MHQEYHIRRTDRFHDSGFREDFEIDTDKYYEIMSPNSFQSKKHKKESLYDLFDIEIMGYGKIGYSWEMGFIHVVFEEDKFSDEIADQIMEEVFSNILSNSGNEGKYLRYK